MNYELKIEEKRNEVKKLESVISILQRLNRDCEYMYMKQIDDDTEQGYHFEEPEEGEWEYIFYKTYQEVMKLIESKYFK